MTVSEQVIACFEKVAKKKPITIDSSFAEIGVDSLDAIEILFEIEEAFDLSIPTEHMKGVRSVREVIAGVERLVAERGASQDPSAARRKLEAE